MDTQQISQRLGRNLFMVRRQAGLSQGELGQKVELTQVKISLFERGEAAPSLEQFVRLCQALSVRPDRLLKGVIS